MAIASWLGIAIAGTLSFTLLWYYYSIGKVREGAFQTSSEVYAAPRRIRVGDALHAADLVVSRRRVRHVMLLQPFLT